MRTGRPPKPTALKLLQGNPGKRRLPRDEPNPSKGRPPKPAHLEGIASVEWDRLCELASSINTLTVVDGPMLEITCLAYQEYREARATVQEEGSSYENTTPQGGLMIRKRPEVTIAADAWRRYSQGLGQFGLSPATRTKVRATESKPAGKLEKFNRARA